MTEPYTIIIFTKHETLSVKEYDTRQKAQRRFAEMKKKCDKYGRLGVSMTNERTHEFTTYHTIPD